MKTYAGIGSRRTPKDVLELMTQIAKKLDRYGHILRSGGADGADSAFEAGSTHKEIYLPWKGFRGKKGIVATTVQIQRAEEIAAKFHPAWHRLTKWGRDLHTRNVFQVLGLNLDSPVKAVLCWTPDEQASGGTGQAIRIAQHHSIKVHNLKNSETEKTWRDWVDK